MRDNPYLYPNKGKYYSYMRAKPIFALLLGLSLGIQLCAQESGDARRPNIIFLMSDDHAYQAISAYDSSLIQTPNIDRIAEEGIKFTNACVTNSICAPSRAVLLTGKHSHLNGKIDNISSFDTSQVTFPQLLLANGYQTAIFGKLHSGNNPKGIDEYSILPGQGHCYNPDFIDSQEGRIQVEGYATDIITQMTLNWLESDRNEEEPFFLICLHKAPHREWLSAKRHFKEFTKRSFSEPPTLFDDYEGRGKAGDSKIYP